MIAFESISLLWTTKRKRRPTTHGKPRLPELPFIVFCNHKLNETVFYIWVTTVKKTTVQKGKDEEQSSMTPKKLVLATHRFKALN